MRLENYSNKLAIPEDRDTLDPVFLQNIREFGERSILIGRDNVFGHELRHPASMRFSIIQSEYARWGDRLKAGHVLLHLKCARQLP